MSGNIEYYKNNDGTTKYFGYVSKNGWRQSVFYPELPGRPGEVDFSKIDNKPSPCCHAPLEASGSGYGSNDKGGVLEVSFRWEACPVCGKRYNGTERRFKSGIVPEDSVSDIYERA